jgi:hypothetical protein
MNTRRWSEAFSLTTFASLLIVLGGCSDDDKISPGRPSEQIDELITSLADVPTPPDPIDEVTVVGEGECETANSTVYSCQQYERKFVGQSQTFPTFADHGIYPGMLGQGASLARGVLDPITVPRGAGSVLLTDINGGTVNTVTLDEVTRTAVTEAQNEIVRNHSGELTADFEMSMTRIRTRQELQIALRMNASYLGIFSASARFDYDEREAKTYFLVSLRQTFYSMSFDRPARPHEFFAEDVSLETVAPHVGPGNPPVYVDQVDYGRIFLLLLESREAEVDMESSVRASFWGQSIAGDVKYLTALTGFNMQVYAYGGDSALAQNAVSSGFGSLQTFLRTLRDGAQVDKAKPLAWRARSVATDQLVYNAYSTQYGFEQCVPSGSVQSPVLTSPSPDYSRMDNGCGCVTNSVRWRFEWRPVTNASQYEIEISHESYGRIVEKTTKTYLVVDFANPFTSSWADWSWKVRAKTACGWGPWSGNRTFGIEALNTDCKTGFTLYKDTNYGGEPLFIAAKSGNLSPLGFNDKASSIKLHNVKSVTLYEHDDKKGRYVIITKDTASLHGSMNFGDRASSWQIAHCQ